MDECIIQIFNWRGVRLLHGGRSLVQLAQPVHNILQVCVAVCGSLDDSENAGAWDLFWVYVGQFQPRKAISMFENDFQFLKLMLVKVMQGCH